MKGCLSNEFHFELVYRSTYHIILYSVKTSHVTLFIALSK